MTQPKRQSEKPLPEPDLRDEKRQRAIQLLDEWMSTPDDVGEERWAEFDRVMERYPFTL